MPFNRTTPHSASKGHVCSTNVSEGTRQFAHPPSQRNARKELETCLARKVELEHEFREIRSWQVSKLSKEHTSGERAAVLDEAKQMRMPFSKELMNIELRIKELRRILSESSKEENATLGERLEKIESKLDAVLRHLAGDAP